MSVAATRARRAPDYDSPAREVVLRLIDAGMIVSAANYAHAERVAFSSTTLRAWRDVDWSGPVPAKVVDRIACGGPTPDVWRRRQRHRQTYAVLVLQGVL